MVTDEWFSAVVSRFFLSSLIGHGHDQLKFFSFDVACHSVKIGRVPPKTKKEIVLLPPRTILACRSGINEYRLQDRIPFGVSFVLFSVV